jgi:hypothetical protein
MIRHVAIFTLKPDADLAQIAAGVEAVRDLVPGMVGCAHGRDLGLREGNGGYAASFDFEDEAAYRAWDTHPEHQRVRRELVLPNVTGVQRSQFRVSR